MRLLDALILLHTLPKAYTQNAWGNDAEFKKVLPLQREGKHAYLQVIHVAAQQKPTQHYKAVILQFNKLYLTSFQQISVTVDSFSDFLSSSFSYSI